MSIGWGLFVWAGIIWMIPFMYFMMKNQCKPKKNIVAGVTLPYEARQDETVLALLEQFRREMKLTCWISLAAVVPSLFIHSFGIFMTVWLLWIVAACFVFFIPYIRCNRALARLKAERGWRREDAPQTVIDLNAAVEEMRWISPGWFLPPFLISLIPLLFDRTMWQLWALDAAMVPVFYLCYRYLYRGRAEVVDDNTDRILALTRVRRYNWGRCWLAVAWATGVFNVGMWLTVDHIWWFMAVILTYTLAVCAAVIGIEFRVRSFQEKLTADSGRGYYVDDDDHWIWGLLYYNPNDRRMVVNDRVGINTTVNLARRPAQVLMGLGLALLLACPLAGVWMIGMENAPVELEVTGTELVGSHYGGHWGVALEDIQSAELLDELPQISRVAGTGMASAQTGTYRCEPWGRFTCCIDPRTGPWLLVTRTDGGIYLFGSSTQDGVETALAALRLGPS
ncbi:MAG: hypothetical protein K2K53_01770 [Oscillospiraceae bacterium]|nr:hypothetical protein [Oscillospiraceae bacterium]